MRPILDRYLAARYQAEVLHQVVKDVDVPTDSEIIAEIEAELASINALKLGPSLAQRDFALYQKKRHLEQLLTRLKAQEQAKAKTTGEVLLGKGK